MEGEARANNELVSYVRPRPAADKAGAFTRTDVLGYEDGKLFRKAHNGVREIVNSSLPQVEWYEVVEIAESPTDANEIWVAIAGRELQCSRDGGKTFKLVKDVAYAAQISFVPILHASKHYAIYMFGTVKSGHKGGFTSVDDGASWQAYDPEQFLPFA